MTVRVISVEGIVCRAAERHLSIRIEGIPVQMPVEIFPRRQYALAIAEPCSHRKGILHAFRQPRRIDCFRLAEKRLEPLQPEPRGLLDFRQIGRSNLQRGCNDDSARACRTEGGIEQPAVGDARCHQIKEAEAVAVECGTLLCRQCRKRILANEGVAVIARQRLLFQHAQELLTCLCGQPELFRLGCLICCRTHRFPLDQRFERHAAAVITRRVDPGVWRDGTGMIAGQPRRFSRANAPSPASRCLRPGTRRTAIAAPASRADRRFSPAGWYSSRHCGCAAPAASNW